MVQEIGIDPEARKQAANALKIASEAALSVHHHSVHDDTRFEALGEKVDTVGKSVVSLSEKVSVSVTRIHERFDTFKNMVLIGALAISGSMLAGAAGIIWTMLQGQIGNGQ